MQVPAIFLRPITLFFTLIFAAAWVIALYFYQPLWMCVPFIALAMYALIPALVKPSITLFWLLIICIPLSTEWQLLPTLGIDFPDELLMILLTAGASFFFLCFPTNLPRVLYQSSLFTLLLMQLIWIGICCIFSYEPLLSVKYLLAKIWYIIPFVVLPVYFIRNIRDWKIWAACWLIPMLILVIQVLIRHGLYGFTFFSIRKAMSPFFRNHVNYAALLTLLLPVAVASYYLTAKESPIRKWILAAIGVGIAGWILAYSRGAWVALPCGIGMVYVIKKRWTAPVMMVAISAILIASAWLVTERNYLRFIPEHDQTYFHTEFRQHMQATFQGKDVSAAERWYRWVAGVRMIVGEPLTGFGPNSFYLHYKPYTLRRFQTWVSNNPEHSTVHNYFLLLALEQGLIGLLLFLALLTGMFISLQRLYIQLQSNFYKTITLTIACLLTILVVVNLMSDLIETDKVGAVFYTSLAAILLLKQQLQQEKNALT